MFFIEVLSAVFGFACVALLIVRNHWSWPVGLVQVLLTAVVLWEAKLYAETALQFLFAILQLYGWWAWLASRSSQNGSVSTSVVRVEKLSAWGWCTSLFATLVMSASLYWVLIRFTDGNSPGIDACITAASITAQVLLASRTLENWLFWIAVDLVSIPLYAHRELYVLAMLYVLYLGLAIGGWVRWRDAFRNERLREGSVR
ncbi:MAG: nicotinamide riboside transporter PnuC [Pirellula sp.]|jgi:nicotinamide mononucleotide transporter